MNSTIILRGHTTITESRQARRARQHKERKSEQGRLRRLRSQKRWPPFALVFDLETRIDANQSLTFGFARLMRKADNSYRECRVELLFYDPEELTISEIRVLRKYVAQKRAATASDVALKKIVLITKQAFIETVFFPHIEAGSLIVGFNLPFDLTRLASDGRPATRVNEDWSLVFQYTDRKTRELRKDVIRRIKITRKDGKIAFIRLSGYSKKKGIMPYGRFLDLFTLAWALRNVHYRLDSLAKDLGLPGKLKHVPTGKVTFEELRYARQDVRVTVGVLNALKVEFDCHPIDRFPDGVYSPASVFKAYLDKTGILPPLKKFRLSSRIQGIAAQAYYGGRSEVRVRLAEVPIVHTDFVSEYPTVITLMGLWKFLTAKRLRVKTATRDVKSLLARIRQNPESIFGSTLWGEFSGYALVEPCDDVLPIRTEYNENSDANNIGVNLLKRSDHPIWFAIPDLIADVLLTEKVPKVIEAFRIVPEGVQEGLQPIDLRGKERIDPVSGNLYKSLIEAKEREKKHDKDQAYFLKIMANAGYGIFIETTPQRVSKSKEVRIFSGGHYFKTKSKIIEDKGKFYCPVIASLITAGGRLLLAILEREVKQAGGTHLLCDTDSMAILATRKGRTVRLTDPEAEKQKRVKALSWKSVKTIVNKFKRLNPYSFGGSILKVEKDSLKRQLYGMGVSAKRYCLFDERLRIVHASSHGLGHLYVPESKWNERIDAPAWVGKAWEYHLRRDSHANTPSWFSKPGMMRVAMTTPKVQMWRILEEQQKDLPFRLRAKPSNFILTPIIDSRGDEKHPDGFPMGVDRGKFMLMAPFSSKSDNWYKLRYINVHGGKQFNLAPLRRKKDSDASPSTLGQIVRTHVLHPESKSLGSDGEPCTSLTQGLLQRTPVSAQGVPRIIGKETDRRWEQEEDPSVFEPILVEYRPNETARIATDTRLQHKLRNCGRSVREVARRTGVNPSTVQNARLGKRIRRSSAAKLWKFLKIR